MSLKHNFTIVSYLLEMFEEYFAYLYIFTTRVMF